MGKNEGRWRAIACDDYAAPITNKLDTDNDDDLSEGDDPLLSLESSRNDTPIIADSDLPKMLRKKAEKLRQIIKERVIDHRVVYEIEFSQPPASSANSGRRKPRKSSSQPIEKAE